MPNYNNAEYYIDTISGRVEQLLKERFILRKELARRSDGNMAQDEAFVQAFMSGTVINAVSSERVRRLSFMLRVSA